MKTSTGGRRAALSGTSSVPSTLTNAPHATDLDGILITGATACSIQATASSR